MKNKNLIEIGSILEIKIDDGNFPAGTIVCVDYIGDKIKPITYRLTNGVFDSYYQLKTINERFINKGKNCY